MALELIVLGCLVILILACFLFAHFTGLKIFWVAGFIVLMLSGIIITTTGGIIVNHYYDIDGVYSNVVLSSSDPFVFIISNFCLWGGLVLVAWSVLFSSMLQASGSERKAFVWD